jgi:outer membrane receptor protein involved in Fe transport
MALLTHLGAVSWIRAQGAAGGLRGVVYDAEFDGPVPEATVRVLELNRQTNTVEDGHFLFSDVPAGSYTLTVSKPGYERFVQAAVVVAAGSLADVTVRLKGEFTEMEELVVRDTDLADTTSEIGLLNLRGTSLSFQDSISKDMMSRAGAGDAATALRLVVGASVADGKYATVRGLSDRYVGTALNGIRIPSSDPRKRAVHLDVFPAGTIESMTVSKTFTPDLPGDYSGGGVNIRTIGIPDKPFFKVSSSREFNRDFTDKPGYVTYDGAGVGRWGRHMGGRGMPAGAEDMEFLYEAGSYNLAKPENQAEIDRITQAMAPTMGTKRTTVPDGNYGLSLSAGNRTDFGGGTVAGWTAAFAYGKKYKWESGPQTEIYVPRWPVNEPAAVEGFEFLSWTNNIGTEELKWSVLGSVGIAQGDDHEVTLTFLRNRAATDRASIRVGGGDPTGDPAYFEQRQAIQYTERSLNVMQLRGKHRWNDWLGEFAGLELDWFGVHNVAEQEEPDVRFFRNFVATLPDGLYDYRFANPGGTQESINKAVRLWRNTKEDNSQVGLNLAFPFKRPRPDSILSLVNVGPQQEPWAQAEGKVKTGFTRDWTHRTYRQNTFWYEGLLPTFTTNTPNALWTDVFSDPDYIEETGREIRPRSVSGGREPWEGDTLYDGEQNLNSGYWMIDLPMTTRFRITCGARLEGTDMRIDPRADRTPEGNRKPFAVPVKDPVNGAWRMEPVTEEAASVSIQEADWLRSVGFVYDLTPEMKVRGTWSQTIARPTMLELAPVINTDYVVGDNLVGNKDLKISHLVNKDLRWEWSPKPGEIFAASLFNKQIKDPIDREAFTFLSQEYLLAVNLPEGTVQGWELEARKSLGFLPDIFQFFSVGANYTFIDAKVKVPLSYLQNYAADDAMLADVGVEPGESNVVHRLGQTERDMEGQPDHLWNINVTWDYEPWGTSAGFFYSVRGDMLRSGVSIQTEGVTAVPNVYSKGFASVNFSLSQKFAKRWKATFQAKNLLDPWLDEVYRFPDGTEVPRRRYREGVTYGFQLGASW